MSRVNIILQSTISGLGKVGDQVSVARGYASNYLIPNKMALFCNKSNLAEFEAKKNELKAADDKLQTELKGVLQQIESLELTITRESDRFGSLYSPINPSEIYSELEKSIPNIANFLRRRDISISSPITSIGSYTVNLSLKLGFATDLKLTVE